jgi:hypothetical protein
MEDVLSERSMPYLPGTLAKRESLHHSGAMKDSRLSRRAFVGVLPLTVLLDPSQLAADPAPPEAGLLSASYDPGQAGCPGACLGSSQVVTPQTAQDGPRPGFSGEFSPEEAERIAPSPMAREIAALQGRGLSCAEMSLLAALRFLGLPESHLGAAGVFGGGVGKGDLCGFLTGSLMAFGLAASVRYGSDRAEMRRVARAMSNEYWDWWLSRGDLHCSILRPAYDGSEDFLRMAQRTPLKAEEVLRTSLPM